MTELIRQWRERAVDWLANHPMSVPGRLAALRYGIPSPFRHVSVVRAPAGFDCRLIVAPTNYAGQARAWCDALEKNMPGVAARNYAVEAGAFAFAADVVVPLAAYHNSRRWQRDQRSAARGFTHMLVESFRPPFGRLDRRDFERQIRSLQPGVEVALMCHGSDVRRPSLNRARTPLSPYRADDPATSRLERLALRNLKVIETLNLPVFVSTPDLLVDVPGAVWCPVVIDSRHWDRPRPPWVGRLRVAHAPSKAHMKGSAQIEPILLRLAEEGVIDYTPVRGVPHGAVPDVFAAADVVVDQFSVGSYGVAACEAMAAGCVVVSHVTQQVRDVVARETARPLPIVEAGPATLAAILRRLAASDDERAQLVQAGREFVGEVHDGRRSAGVLSDWMLPATRKIYS